jgi:hypothetical protein
VKATFCHLPASHAKQEGAWPAIVDPYRFDRLEQYSTVFITSVSSTDPTCSTDPTHPFTSVHTVCTVDAVSTIHLAIAFIVFILGLRPAC